MKIIYHFSSQSVSFLVISESVTGSILGIISFIKDEDKEAIEIILLIMELIGILIITFATLLYDEVIIINKWNLNLYVRKDIIRRGEDEVSKTIELEFAKETNLEENLSPENEIKESLQSNNEYFDVGEND